MRQNAVEQYERDHLAHVRDIMSGPLYYNGHHGLTPAAAAEMLARAARAESQQMLHADGTPVMDWTNE